jgi:hypothetical protein
MPSAVPASTSAGSTDPSPAAVVRMRVEDQDRDGDPRAEPADQRQREQEPEHCQARNRLRDVGKPHDRRARARPLRRQDADRHADDDGGERGHRHEEHVLQEQPAQLHGM